MEKLSFFFFFFFSAQGRNFYWHLLHYCVVGMVTCITCMFSRRWWNLLWYRVRSSSLTRESMRTSSKMAETMATCCRQMARSSSLPIASFSWARPATLRLPVWLWLGACPLAPCIAWRNSALWFFLIPCQSLLSVDCNSDPSPQRCGLCVVMVMAFEKAPCSQPSLQRRGFYVVRSFISQL